MKRVLIVATVAGSVGAANAQSAFEGFYGQIGIGYENNSISSYTANIDIPVEMNSSNNGSVSGVIGFGYYHSVSKDFLLGIGADYGIASSNKFNSSAPTDDIFSNEVSNRYNIFITPGYIIDKNQLAYFKAGYSSQTIKITDQSGFGTDGELIGSGNVNGYVVGLGFKQMFQRSLFGFAEANYYSYSSKSFTSTTLSDGYSVNNVSPKSSAYQFLVGIGYKF